MNPDSKKVPLYLRKEEANEVLIILHALLKLGHGGLDIFCTEAEFDQLKAYPLVVTSTQPNTLHLIQLPFGLVWKIAELCKVKRDYLRDKMDALPKPVEPLLTPVYNKVYGYDESAAKLRVRSLTMARNLLTKAYTSGMST